MNKLIFKGIHTIGNLDRMRRFLKQFNSKYQTDFAMKGKKQELFFSQTNIQSHKLKGYVVNCMLDYAIGHKFDGCISGIDYELHREKHGASI